MCVKYNSLKEQRSPQTPRSICSLLYYTCWYDVIFCNICLTCDPWQWCNCIVIACSVNKHISDLSLTWPLCVSVCVCLCVSVCLCLCVCLYVCLCVLAGYITKTTVIIVPHNALCANIYLCITRGKYILHQSLLYSRKHHSSATGIQVIVTIINVCPMVTSPR